MNKYAEGKIYKINSDKIYIESTYKSLNNRLRSHKRKCIEESYEFLYEHLNKIEWNIELIESFPCDSRKELEARRDYWIETLSPCLNNEITLKEKAESRQQRYYRVNKIRYNIYRKEYRRKQKELKGIL